MEYHNEQERYIAILEASLPYVAPQLSLIHISEPTRR